MPSAADLVILVPALCAGALVLATHVPLGRLVLERGIVFIDLAIAQTAGLGGALAQALGWETDGLALQLSAFGAALAAALLLHWTERKLAAVQEAVIGVVFVATASLEILLTSFNPHGAEHLKDLLAGQILWVGPAQLGLAALATLPLLVGLARFDLRHHRALFYPLFAAAVTVSVQLVGVYLVFASLILPALAGRGRQHSLRVGVLVGSLGYLLGGFASLVWDLPTGAVIVCALALCAAPWIHPGIMLRLSP
ncbi:metal ABC transporter permease [Phaeospirillum tilakii]|uniref:Metal ABC transporter permease n=1 Tax=Phaeospirillum tilakii TaxID=741673 RepID=A0ABW5CHI2_9PROT